MRRMKAPAFFRALFLSMFFLISITVTQPSHAQEQSSAAGAAVSVRMIEAVDSSKDPAGKQYRASVAKAVDAGNGLMIPQGASAAVTLANSNGSGWTTQLISVTVNGQPVPVTSSSASVTAAAQNAAGNAVRSINSVLGGFGHHVNAPAAAAGTAIATGQRVVLLPGTVLTFLLSQPPAPSEASPAAPAVAAASGPSSPQAMQPSSAPVAAAGQHWWLCQYVDPKDPYKPVAGSRVYFSVFPARADFLDDHGKSFNAYVQQNYKVIDTVRNPSGAYNGTSGGYCKRISDDAAGRANSMDMFQKGWRRNNMEAIQVNYADAQAHEAIIDPKQTATSVAPPATSTGGPFIACATSGGAGIDTYLTGVFQTTRPVRHLPSGGALVDQSILDHFYAYLTQKGYNFKPGSNYGCAVERSEAEAKADQHKRVGGCSTCGKIVETGWKDPSN